MDENRREGYTAGAICVLLSVILGIFAFNNEWNLSGQILWIFTIFFGGLGIGSLWKPDVIGGVASQILENFSKGIEEESDSSNIQVQKDTSDSIQIIATKGSRVNVHASANDLVGEKLDDIQVNILHVLKEEFDADPDKLVTDKTLVEKTKLTLQIIKPHIEYLEQKKYIKVFRAYDSLACQISAKGIDMLS